MISFDAIKAYREQYPEDECHCGEPTGIFISSKCGTYWVPDNFETDKEFFDRLERSKEAGRNLFYEEWKPFEGYKEGCMY